MTSLLTDLRKRYADLIGGATICAYHAQMVAKFKASDVYKTAGCTRDQLRGLLQEIHWPNSSQPQRRVARTYSELEFLVLLIACELDQSFMLKRTAIAELSPLIYRELAMPRSLAISPRLAISIVPPSVRFLDGASEVESGLVIPLKKIFAQVDALTANGGVGETIRAQLNFGPELVAHQQELQDALTSSPLGKAGNA